MISSSKKIVVKKPTKKRSSPKLTATELNNVQPLHPVMDIYKGLKKYFGFNEFKGTQEESINSLLSGHDTFVIMPTGGGKSLCYQLPAMITPGVAIIVSPLIALMKNQVDLIRGYSEKDDVAHFLNSSLNKTQIKLKYNPIKERIRFKIARSQYKCFLIHHQHK